MWAFVQVPLISVGQPVNESVLSFAISSWSEIAYHDPSLTQYQFKIAEDLIYDIGNDTFAGRNSCPGTLTATSCMCTVCEGQKLCSPVRLTSSRVEKGHGYKYQKNSLPCRSAMTGAGALSSPRGWEMMLALIMPSA